MPGLAEPADYVHHRFGDVAELRSALTACGWQVSDVRAVTSVRRCTDEELWRWLWGSLPLRTADGAFLSPSERAEIEGTVREAFFVQAERLREPAVQSSLRRRDVSVSGRHGGIYVVRSLAHLVVATAGTSTERTRDGQ